MLSHSFMLTLQVAALEIPFWYAVFAFLGKILTPTKILLLLFVKACSFSSSVSIGKSIYITFI